MVSLTASYLADIAILIATVHMGKKTSRKHIKWQQCSHRKSGVVLGTSRRIQAIREAIRKKTKTVIFLKQKTQDGGMGFIYLMKSAPVCLAYNCSSKSSAGMAKLLLYFSVIFHRTYDFQTEVVFLPCMLDSSFFFSFLNELQNLPTSHICPSY